MLSLFTLFTKHEWLAQIHLAPFWPVVPKRSMLCNSGWLYLGQISPPVLQFWNVCHVYFCWKCNKPFLNLESRIRHCVCWGPTPLQWRHNGRNGVSNHQPHDCLLNRLFKRRSKKTSKLRVTVLCEGNPSVTGEFPAEMARSAENVSIWWRHHGLVLGLLQTRWWRYWVVCNHRPVIQSVEIFMYSTWLNVTM